MNGAQADRGVVVPRVLSVAGSDPSGGAGIQADLKSIAANGGYGMAAITALTAQNTQGVRAVHVPPPAFLRCQLDAVSDDVQLDAVKIGMLGDAAVIDTVREWLTRTRPPVVVLDPVMIATSGDRLLAPGAEAALRELLPLADVVTPNLPELAVLVGAEPAASWEEALEQAGILARDAEVLVLVKGGHLGGAGSPDALVGADGVIVQIDAPRIAGAGTHGTGCSLSSALATRYAATGDWTRALRETKTWLNEAIAAGPQLQVGHGNGPISHFAPLWRARQPQPETITAGWWAQSAEVRAAIDVLPFVTALAAGTLDEAVFRHYLEQDALYLRDYARVLARASALAPTREEQAFWAEGARGSLLGELELHSAWLGGEPHGVEPSAVTRAYLDHLLAAGPDYGTIVAAVLPCYWIYQDVGRRLIEHAHGEHPYLAWLETYADAGFEHATREAVRWAGLAAARASEADRERMARAFRLSSEHELAFFSLQ